ncbi:MAG TPA: hypothetical protein VGK67_28070 [Myxococcales bacterium]
MIGETAKAVFFYPIVGAVLGLLFGALNASAATAAGDFLALRAGVGAVLGDAAFSSCA